jgi:hypothetical protein
VFEPRDVENDSAARAELAALGLRNVPVTVVGSSVVSGFNPGELAQLFNLAPGAEKKVADARLFETLDRVLEAVIRAARQVPHDALMWTTPDRDRPLKVFCYHILADPNHVLDAIGSQTYDGSFKLTYGEDAAAFKNMAAVAEYGEKTRVRLKEASVRLTAAELGRPIEGYAGRTDGHELLHQLLSHSAHHLRQLYAMLGTIGVAPKDPLTERDFHGIPMPEELW